jgi:hypothetical protein
MTTMSTEQVREIAENAANAAAEKAVRDILTALGIDVQNLTKEQQVWAFARRMHDGTNRGIRAAFTGIIGAMATAFAGWIWLMFFNRPPHP